MHICVICKQVIDTTEDVMLTEKGCKGINVAAEARGENLYAVSGQVTHKGSREMCTQIRKKIAQHRKQTILHSSPKPHGKKELRSSEANFPSCLLPDLKKKMRHCVTSHECMENW